MEQPGWPRIEGGGAQAADPQVVRDWIADPAPFHAVVVLLHSASVERRMRQVVRALHPWCAASTPTQPHITLVACGPARPAVPLGLPVEVAVGGADSFTAAAFLHVTGDLLALREEVLGSVPEVDPHPAWLPHLTVGTYRWPVPREQAARRLLPWRDAAAVPASGRVAVVRVDKATGRLLET